MLDDIMIFIQLVDCGSFKQTGQLINLQQSTVSKRIINLEDKLGKRLLVRDTKNITLTESGQSIYERFRHLQTYLTDSIKSINNEVSTSKLQGSLKISLATALAYELICPHIKQFNTNHPDISLSLMFQAQKIDWNANNFDLILSPCKINGENLDHRFIRTEVAKFYCTRDYVMKHGVPQTPAELNKHNLISMLDMDGSPIEFTKMTNSKTKQEYVLDLTNSKLKTNSVLHMKKIGFNAEYIFGCWEGLCADDVKYDQLIPVLPDWYTYSLDFYLVSRKNISQIEQKFIDFIYTCMGYS